MPLADNLEPGPPTDHKQLFPCEQCGSSLEFKPGSDSMRCPHCGHTQALPAGARGVIHEHDFHAGIARARMQPSEALVQGGHNVQCEGCGAQTVVAGQAARCPFCGAPVVMAVEKLGEIFAPESLLPFKLDARAAKDCYQKSLLDLMDEVSGDKPSSESTPTPSPLIVTVPPEPGEGDAPTTTGPVGSRATPPGIPGPLIPPPRHDSPGTPPPTAQDLGATTVQPKVAFPGQTRLDPPPPSERPTQQMQRPTTPVRQGQTTESRPQTPQPAPAQPVRRDPAHPATRPVRDTPAERPTVYVAPQQSAAPARRRPPQPKPRRNWGQTLKRLFLWGVVFGVIGFALFGMGLIIAYAYQK